MNNKHRPILVLTAIMMALSCCVMFASCSASAKDARYVAESPAMENMSMAADNAMMDTGAATPKGEEAGFGGEIAEEAAKPAVANEAAIQGTANLPNRKIIMTVNLSVETLEFDKLIKGIEDTKAELGGYTQSSSISGLGVNESKDEYYSGGRRTAYITVRVPTAKLNDFVTAVGTMGNVVQKDENSEDITLNYADNEARQSALKVEYDRLMALLEKADTIETVVALEARLSEVRYELDSIGSTLRKYDSLIEYSTVNINVNEVRLYTPQKEKQFTLGERMSAGLSETWYNIKTGCGDLAVWFVVNLPYLLIWAVIVVVILIIILCGVKKGKAKRLALAEAAANTVAQAPPITQAPQTPMNFDEKK